MIAINFELWKCLNILTWAQTMKSRESLELETPERNKKDGKWNQCKHKIMHQTKLNSRKNLKMNQHLEYVFEMCLFVGTICQILWSLDCLNV
jgi:hypothetical protein